MDGKEDGWMDEKMVCWIYRCVKDETMVGWMDG